MVQLCMNTGQVGDCVWEDCVLAAPYCASASVWPSLPPTSVESLRVVPPLGPSSPWGLKPFFQPAPALALAQEAPLFQGHNDLWISWTNYM